MENNYKTDPLTGEQFMPKKSSQRFASSANRIKFNNDLSSKLRQETAYINTPIKKNHRLLKKLMGNKKEAEFSFDFMEGAGYDFRVSNHHETIDGINQPCIYEFLIIKNMITKTLKIINNG